MKSKFIRANLSRRDSFVRAIAWALMSASALVAAQQSTKKAGRPRITPASSGAKLFDTPQHAADAPEKFDVAALTEIFGPDGVMLCSAVNSRRTANLLLISLLKRVRRKAFRSILRVGIAHSSSVFLALSSRFGAGASAAGALWVSESLLISFLLAAGCAVVTNESLNHSVCEKHQRKSASD